MVVDPEATLVQELVVTARLPGPAWWKVSSPTSTVYVLGAPGALPKGMAWDIDASPSAVVTGANELIVPPVIMLGWATSFDLMSAARRIQIRQGPMEDGLPPDLRASGA